MKKIFTKGEITWIICTIVLMIVIGSTSLTSCTENERARMWGGEMTINIPASQKLVNVTWKESEVWVLTHPMRPDETPETYSFYEKSPFGIMEGEIKLIESR